MVDAAHCVGGESGLGRGHQNETNGCPNSRYALQCTYVSRSVGTQESHLRRNRDGRDLVGDRWNGDVTEPRVNGFQVDPEILFLAGLVVAKP